MNWEIVDISMCDRKKPLTLKINLSRAICKSKNEDVFLSCYLCVTVFSKFLLRHTIRHSPICICQPPIYKLTTFPKFNKNILKCLFICQFKNVFIYMCILMQFNLIQILKYLFDCSFKNKCIYCNFLLNVV